LKKIQSNVTENVCGVIGVIKIGSYFDTYVEIGNSGMLKDVPKFLDEAVLSIFIILYFK
jgi:hypothetical protein